MQTYFLDGRKCGFGFVQFNQLSAAETAVAEMNAKEILGEFIAEKFSFIIAHFPPLGT